MQAPLFESEVQGYIAKHEADMPYGIPLFDRSNLLHMAISVLSGYMTEHINADVLDPLKEQYGDRLTATRARKEIQKHREDCDLNQALEGLVETLLRGHVMHDLETDTWWHAYGQVFPSAEAAVRHTPAVQVIERPDGID